MNIFSIKWIFISLLFASTLFHPSIVKQSRAIENDRFKDAQAIIEKIVSKYPQIVRLTIHAVPTGEKNSRVIACNVKEKLGKPSDPEDLEAMKTNKTIVLKEGDNLDVTVPICDKEGVSIAATGITLRYKKEEKEDAVIEKAKAIVTELTNAVQNAGKVLW